MGRKYLAVSCDRSVNHILIFLIISNFSHHHYHHHNSFDSSPIAQFTLFIMATVFALKLYMYLDILMCLWPLLQMLYSLKCLQDSWYTHISQPLITCMAMLYHQTVPLDLISDTAQYNIPHNIKLTTATNWVCVKYKNLIQHCDGLVLWNTTVIVIELKCTKFNTVIKHASGKNTPNMPHRSPVSLECWSWLARPCLKEIQTTSCINNGKVISSTQIHI